MKKIIQCLSNNISVFVDGLFFSKPETSHREMKRVVVTGGAGFIGSHLVKLFLEKGIEVVVLDSLTYAGDLTNLQDCNYQLWMVDIADLDSLKKAFEGKTFDAIVHLAAESHVDRSIEDPLAFVRTNVNGTVNLLEIAVEQHRNNPNFIFYHVSTDEVFGSLPLKGNQKFREDTSYDPRSPYSASKASSDHFVRAYHHTYGLPIVISNCSNNYGTHQYPEKLIPVIVQNLVEGKRIPVYGDGSNKRDWLHVKDHARAIYEILTRGNIGETYCVGGNNVMSNLHLVQLVCSIYDDVVQHESSDSLIVFVKDRKGHDLKYAIDASKLKLELGWEPIVPFEEGLEETIKWYINYFEKDKK